MLWRLICVTQFCILLIIYTYLGLTPHPEKSIPVYNDLLMHFSGYFIAAISIRFARPQAFYWQSALFLITYSIAIEIAQHFNPPRTFSFSDIVANGSGVVAGLLFVALLSRYLKPFRYLLYWKLD